MLTFFQTESEPQSAIPLMLVFLGENYDQEPVERPLGVPNFQCFLSLRGQGNLFINGERMTVREGDCFLLYPGVPCSYRASSGKWIIANAGFTGAVCSPLFDALGLTESGVYSCSDPQVFLKNQRVLKKLTERSNDQRDWSSACYEFLLALSKTLTFRSASDPLTQEYSDNTYAYRVIHYLENHLTEPLYIPALAESLGVNPQYLCTAFKKETGLTIITYLQRLRIGSARMMLERYPERSAAEIGRAVGYDSPSYFGAQFKKLTGLTPDQYRKKGAVVRQN